MGRSLRVDWIAAFAVGVAIGVAATAWSVHWPVQCKIDGMLFWTASAALGGIGATFAAVYAARVALRVAKAQMLQAQAKSAARAANLSALIRDELESAAQSVDLLITLNSKISESTPASTAYKVLSTSSLPVMEYTEKYAIELDETPEAHKVALSISKIRRLRALLGAFKSLAESRTADLGAELHTSLMESVTIASTDAKTAVAAAIAILPKTV